MRNARKFWHCVCASALWCLTVFFVVLNLITPVEPTIDTATGRTTITLYSDAVLRNDDLHRRVQEIEAEHEVRLVRESRREHFAVYRIVAK